MHTEGGDGQRLGVVLGGNGLAVHATVVPEGALQTFLAFETALRAKETLKDSVVSQVAACMVVEFLLLGLDTVENRDGMVRRAVVIAPHHGLVIGIGADNGYLLRIFLQWQNVILIL